MLIKRKKLLRLLRKEIRKLNREKHVEYDTSVFYAFYEKIKDLEVPFSFSKVWEVYDALYEGYSYPWGSTKVEEKEEDITVSSLTTEQFSLLVLMENLIQRMGEV